MNERDQVVEDALNDAAMEESAGALEPADDDIPADPAEVASDEPTEPVDAPADDSGEPVKAKDAPAKAAPAEDEFSKRFGIPAKSVTGSENRIPYSRVKAIVKKNEADVTTRVNKEWEAKVATQTQEYTTKIQSYEQRLGQVAEFERIMEKEPRTFLNMLAKLPVYKPFFDAVTEAMQGKSPASAAGSGGGAPKPTTPVSADDPMPQPNKRLADGSTFYDMEGLQALMEWQARQVEKRVAKQVEERYAPIEQDWQTRQHINQITPVIERQIAEARTWPLFNENEQEIVVALRADRNLTLEGAYRKVVVPKLQINQDQALATARTRVIEDMKRKPIATAVPANGAQPRRPARPAPKSREDVIFQALEEAGISVDQ